jgi:hypothetical protein
MKILFAIATIFLIGLFACTNGDKLPPNFPSRLIPRKSYTSTPAWSSSRDYHVVTRHGTFRIFNASLYQIDTNLLVEIIVAHGTPWKKLLELRVFNDNFVIRDSVKGFGLAAESGRAGDTISTDRFTWSIIPTGWAPLVREYESPYGFQNIQGRTPEEYITMCITHELIVHGIARASGEGQPGMESEERVAQYFERAVHHTLQGRTLVKKK